MVSKWSLLILSALLYAKVTALRIPETKNPADTMTEDEITSYKQSLQECFKTKKFAISQDPDPIDMYDGMTDVQCAMKYMWTVGIGGASISYDEDYGASNNYKKAFGYDEPLYITFEGCDAISAYDYLGSYSTALTAMCLEHCETQCRNQLQKDKYGYNKDRYPVGKLVCDYGRNRGRGCDEQRTCNCTSIKGKSCGPAKVFTVGEVIDAYTDTCLNCKNNRHNFDREQPMKTCILGMENWTAIWPPTSVMKTFMLKWRNFKNQLKQIKPKDVKVEKPKDSDA